MRLRRITLRQVLPRDLLLLAPALLLTATAARAIDGVRLGAASFNPTLGDELAIAYELSAGDEVWVRVYDPDGGLVRTLVDGEPREAGPNQETWDGRDFEGRRVPDEAYLVILETASGEVYDPTTVSGGIVGDLTDARFDRQAGTVTYRLPAASRVLIRLGVRNGPMLKTLVDWRPRLAGSVTEYWDGRDEDGLIDLRSEPGFTALITYVTLPDATVIAYGNREESYRDYALERGKDRARKPDRPRAPEPEARLRPEGLVPPAWSRAPRVSLTFPEHTEDVPEVRGEVRVRVGVDAADRDLLLKEQFEIIFFVDNVFFAEAERGHLPFNWPWELQQLPPGEHVLTVNISSFKGQVGVASRKVRVLPE